MPQALRDEAQLVAVEKHDRVGRLEAPVDSLDAAVQAPGRPAQRATQQGPAGLRGAAAASFPLTQPLLVEVDEAVRAADEHAVEAEGPFLNGQVSLLGLDDVVVGAVPPDVVDRAASEQRVLEEGA